MANISKKGLRQFTVDDRKLLEKMYKTHNTTEIAEFIDKDPASVWRELRRCQGEYSAKKAQANYYELQHRKYRYSRCEIPVTKAERKQIETCIKMQPTVDKKTVINVTGIDAKVVNCYFDLIRKQVMTLC